MAMYNNQAQRSLSELQFNVAQLLKETTGATRSYDLSGVEVIGDLDEDVTLVSPLRGHIKFLRTGQSILVTGKLEAMIEKSCGRCLEPFTAPIAIELEEEFYPTFDIVTGAPLPQAAEADEANLIDEHHILDLQEVTRQEFLLESDTALYCHPDCKGLCPHCGLNRNTESCNCQDGDTDLRWAGLQSIQLEDE